jgi:hypothetical protein
LDRFTRFQLSVFGRGCCRLVTFSKEDQGRTPFGADVENVYKAYHDSASSRTPTGMKPFSTSEQGRCCAQGRAPGIATSGSTKPLPAWHGWPGALAPRAGSARPGHGEAQHPRDRPEARQGTRQGGCSILIMTRFYLLFSPHSDGSLPGWSDDAGKGRDQVRTVRRPRRRRWGKGARSAAPVSGLSPVL